MKLARGGFVITFLIGVFAARAGWAQTSLRDDYQAAEKASGNGCGTLPYKDLRTDCKAKEKAKGKACTGPKLTCKREKPEIMDPINKIMGKRKDIDAAQKVRDEDQRVLTDLENKPWTEENGRKVHEQEEKVKADDDKITKLNEDIDKLTEDLEAVLRTRQANRGVCERARLDFKDNFDQATTLAKGITDKDIAPIAARLIARWDAAAADHKIEMDHLADVDRFCTEALSRIGDYIDGKLKP